LLTPSKELSCGGPRAGEGLESGSDWAILAHPESLTRRKFREKEISGLIRQNRRMFPGMGTGLRTFSERTLLTLAIGLFIACVANVALVWAFI
jgi:hypothetical protein